MKPNQENERIELGPETDNRLFEALKQTLQELKATGLDSSWGVAGSQELSKWVVKIGNETIEVEAETYVGLSVCGGQALIRKIADMVQSKMKK